MFVAIEILYSVMMMVIRQRCHNYTHPFDEITETISYIQYTGRTNIINIKGINILGAIIKILLLHAYCAMCSAQLKMQLIVIVILITDIFILHFLAIIQRVLFYIVSCIGFRLFFIDSLKQQKKCQSRKWKSKRQFVFLFIILNN